MPEVYTRGNQLYTVMTMSNPASNDWVLWLKVETMAQGYDLTPFLCSSIWTIDELTSLPLKGKWQFRALDTTGFEFEEDLIYAKLAKSTEMPTG